MTGKDGNGNGILTRQIIIAQDKRLDAILQGMGNVRTDIAVLIEQGKERKNEITDLKNKLTEEIQKINTRINGHLEDHKNNFDFMGAGTLARKIAGTKLFWRIVMILFFVNIILSTVTIIKG